MKFRKCRNRRKSQTMNVMTGRSAHAAGILVAIVAMVVVNLVAESRCTQIRTSIGEKEKLLSKLEEDLQRESAAWETMTAPAKVEQALLRHGLKMPYAKPEQVIYMNADGAPRIGQRSVELAKRRQASSVPVASNTRRRR